MKNPAKFRVQAGALVFEVEGAEAFVQKQIGLHRENIEAILGEQAKIIKSGKIPAVAPRRRGRPPKAAGAGRIARAGRRPGRHPVIIRDSSLVLGARQIEGLKRYLASVAGKGQLAKDATVFAIAYFLATEVLKKDVFTAGDISAAFGQMGKQRFTPAPGSIDIVQMLRNLAAASIGKVWVARNSDGTFALTAKGKAVGASGAIVRPRGRRPGTGKAAATKRPDRKPGRPAATAGRRRGRPRKVDSQ